MSERHMLLLLNIILMLCFCALFAASHKKPVGKKGDMIYYQINCLCCFVWMFFNMFPYLGMDMKIAFPINTLRYLGIAFMPPLLVLHIWSQFSSKSISIKKLILLFIPASFSCILVISNPWYHLFIKGFHTIDPSRPYRIDLIYNWGFYLHCLFSYTAIIPSMFFLLRGFFLVPKHMRKSINLMLFGLTATIISNIIVLYAGARLSYDITTIGSVITAYFLYLALTVTRSANLILTSRDYVWESLSSMILVLDENRRILDFNSGVRIQARKLSMPILLEPYEQFRSRWIESGRGRISKYNADIITFPQGALERHYRIRMHAMKECSESPGWLVEISEITEIYKLLRYMEASSRYDYLTGLYNRNAFIDMAPSFCRAESYPLLVIIGDANGLKKVNDEQGHLAGDKLLQTFARILGRCAPEHAFIARMGGDEFVLLIPNSSLEYGEEFIKCVDEACLQQESEIFGVPGIALGAALLESQDQTLQQVVEEADKKMYLKKRGKGGSETRRRYLYQT